METHTWSLMDTELYVAVAYEQPTHWQPIVSQWFHYVAAQWSRFEQHNELAALNALAVGDTIRIQPPLYQCLQLAHTYYEQTDGIFSPYLQQQIVAHGYDTTFAAIRPSQQPIPAVDAPALAFLPHQTVVRASLAQVDIGGIAKGFAAHYAAKLLQSLGQTKHGLVDVGGDMQMWAYDDKVWTIGIANPYTKENLTAFPLKNGAVATSSRVKRSWANGTKNHLLHGQTGDMYRGELLQVTAVAPTAYAAEVAAKVSFFTANTQHYFPQIHRYVVEPTTHSWR